MTSTLHTATGRLGREIPLGPTLHHRWHVCLTAVLLFTAARPAQAADPDGPLTLPVEVLGAPNCTETCRLVLPTGAATVTGLQLTMHGLTYEGKASVQLNGGAWRTLTNGNVEMPQVEKGFWGMGGIHSTLRMTVPLKAGEVKNGANTVVFRFNDQDGKSIGYRVLGVNFVAGTKELLPASAFHQDEPAAWTAPHAAPAAIAEGKTLWYSAPLTHGKAKLVARCADCHAHDGRDLKYFNYSNKSIVERSIFHGLTRTQGEQIASYIRSLPVPYEAKGRPWNPPYQPGPGMDARPVRSWAAGAGLEAVLANDLQTLNYIFPGGIAGKNLAKDLNVREIPLAVQFPDWNRWLPEVHPNDAYPDVYPKDLYVALYATLRSNLAGKSPEAAAKYFNSKKSVWDGANGTGVSKPDRKDPQYGAWAEKRKALGRWRIVKTWEMMTEFKMEEAGVSVFGAESDNRRWFHGEVFRAAPHMLGLVHTPSFHAESMQWYQLQLVLNDGNHHNPSIVPIDWGYLHALNLSAWRNDADLLTYSVMVLNVIKGIEVSMNGQGPAAKGRGWNPHVANIHWLAPGKTMNRHYKLVPEATRRAVAEVVLERWLTQCELYPRAQYEEAGHLRESERGSFRRYLRGAAQNFNEIGVARPLVNRLVDFAARMYPDEDWADARPDKKKN